jgi:hypothetical protein
MATSELTSSTLLRPVERPLVMQALDCPGYVPIVGGIPVGVIRMVCGLAGAVITGLGALFTYCCSDKWCGRFSFAADYLLDEFIRGGSEILCLSYFLDKRKERYESEGTITENGGASGKYIYQSPSGFMAYSVNNHNNKNVLWSYRMVGCEIHGIYGHIVPINPQTAQ